ncbi:LPD7 domain-containing protein [Pseudomonas cedrina]|uniref:LPD7 domain-containing protein n=1 Tax=Pseudomonas cedrina TaxID=651740 RepID=UPI003ED98D02
MASKSEIQELFTALSNNNVDTALAIFSASKTMSPNMKEPFSDGIPLLQSAVRGELSSGAKFDGQKLLDGLIQRGVDVNMRLPSGKTVLHEPGLTVDSAKALIAAGANLEAKVSKADPDAGQVKGETPLLSQVKSGNNEVARQMIEAGANVNARDQDKVTPLHVVKDGRTASALLDAGADIDAKTGSKEDPVRAGDALKANGMRLLAATYQLVKARSSDKEASQAELTALVNEQREARAEFDAQKQAAKQPQAENSVERGFDQEATIDPQVASLVAEQRESLRAAARNPEPVQDNSASTETKSKSEPELDSQARDFANQRREDLRAQRTPPPEPVLESADLEARQFAARARERVQQQRALHGLEQRSAQGPAQQAPQASAEQNPDQEQAPASKIDSARSKAIPEHVKAKFVQVEDKYYFPDKTHAFDDKGQKLSTTSENKLVIASLVDIAKERGWDQVTVRGTEDFRRAAWFEASLNGLEVSGYRPNAIEKAQLAKLIKDTARETEKTNSIEVGSSRVAGSQTERADRAPASQGNPTSPKGESSAAAAAGQSQGTSDRGSDLPDINVPQFGLRDGVVTGQLVEHGQANYQFDKKKDKSYFVKVMTEAGERTVWGKDLGRAVREGKVVPGENVVLEKVETKGVIAKEKVFDEQGNQTGTRDVDAIRNTWKVGSVDKAKAFVQGDRSEVVEKHPELAPAYGTVAAAHKFAQQAWPNSKSDQERFVAVTQAAVAQSIAHGDEMKAPKIREAKIVKEKGQDLPKADKPAAKEHAR